MNVWCCWAGEVKWIRTPRLTCDASWEKMVSKRKVFGAAAEDRLWPAAESPAADVSQRVSCFFLPSTLRSDMDSEDSLLWTEQIRTITLTCRRTGISLIMKQYSFIRDNVMDDSRCHARTRERIRTRLPHDRTVPTR